MARQRRLEDKCAIVTGAGRGIGKAIARKFLEEGARVVACDLAADRIEKTASELRPLGEIRPLAGDVTDPAFGDRLLEQTLRAFDRVDVLVNNAGITAFRPFLEQTDEDWHRVIDVNLTATFKLGQKVARAMAARGAGTIVNMASTNGHVGEAQLASYNASKGVVVLLTRTMAAELAGHGIRVNCVSPGFIHTEIMDDAGMVEHYQAEAATKVPLARMGRAEEVANVFAFLASDEASFVNGASLIVDGGQICKQ